MPVKELHELIKPITKLVGVLSTHLGKFSASYLIRRRAEADAHKIAVISEAIDDANRTRGLAIVYKDSNVEIAADAREPAAPILLPQITLEHRALSRIAHQEERRQENIERITATAAEELVEQDEVPNTPPDDDWIARFFNYAQEISAQEMQLLWGKVLAGEVCRPGTYSMRALDALRNITRDEADLFERFVHQSVVVRHNDGHESFVIEPSELMGKKIIQYFERLKLTELGLLNPADASYQTFEGVSDKDASFIAGNACIRISRGGINLPIRMNIWKLTSVGDELATLVARDDPLPALIRVAGKYPPIRGEVAIYRQDSVDGEGWRIYRKQQVITEDMILASVNQ